MSELLERAEIHAVSMVRQGHHRVAETLRDLANEVRRLEATPKAAAQGEPVAWLVRNHSQKTEHAMLTGGNNPLNPPQEEWIPLTYMSASPSIPSGIAEGLEKRLQSFGCQVSSGIMWRPNGLNKSVELFELAADAIAAIKGLERDAMRLASLADAGAAVSFGEYIAQVITSDGKYFQAHHKKPKVGEAVVHPSKLDALRAAIDAKLAEKGS